MALLRALTLLLAGLGKFCLSLVPTDLAQVSELANTTAHTSRNPPLVAKQAKLALKPPDESDSCHRQNVFSINLQVVPPLSRCFLLALPQM